MSGESKEDLMVEAADSSTLLSITASQPITESQLTSSTFEIELLIGGRNVSTAIPIFLKPLNTTTTGELKQLFKLIEKIEGIPIYVHDFQRDAAHQFVIKNKLDAFLNHIQALLQLHCLAEQKNEIHDAVCLFLESTIQNIKTNPIEPGMPGYPKYLDKLTTLDQAIQDIRHALTKAAFDTQNSPLSIINPVNMNEDSFGNLPQTLHEFEESITGNEACMTQWLEYFEQYRENTDTLTLYALKKIEEIREISQEHHAYARQLIGKIKHFTNELRSKHMDLPGIDILEDIASGANSPRELSRTTQDTKHRKKPIQYVYEADLERLKSYINELIQTKEFTTTFTTFRQLLTRMLEQYPDRKRHSLGELHAYVNHKDMTLKATQMLSKYINQCFIRATKQPLPENFSEDYAKLQAYYGHNQATARQKRKLEFLNQWISRIHASPEKTYAECYHEVEIESQADPKIRAMLSESRCSFFSQHRFKTFINGLLAEDSKHTMTSSS